MDQRVLTRPVKKLRGLGSRWEIPSGRGGVPEMHGGLKEHAPVKLKVLKTETQKGWRCKWKWRRVRQEGGRGQGSGEVKAQAAHLCQILRLPSHSVSHFNASSPITSLPVGGANCECWIYGILARASGTCGLDPALRCPQTPRWHQWLRTGQGQSGPWLP